MNAAVGIDKLYAQRHVFCPCRAIPNNIAAQSSDLRATHSLNKLPIIQ